MSTLGEVSMVPLMHQRPCDLGLTCLVKRRKPVLGFKSTILEHNLSAFSKEMNPSRVLKMRACLCFIHLAFS